MYLHGVFPWPLSKSQYLIPKSYPYIRLKRYKQYLYYYLVIRLKSFFKNKKHKQKYFFKCTPHFSLVPVLKRKSKNKTKHCKLSLVKKEAKSFITESFYSTIINSVHLKNSHLKLTSNSRK